MKKFSILLAGLMFSASFGQELVTQSIAVPAPISNLGSNEILLDQTAFGTSGIVSDIGGAGEIVASADDIDLTYAATKITKITAFGFCNSGDLSTTATGVNFYIIADDDWIPSGSNPQTDNLYAFEMNMGDPGFTFTEDGTSYTFELDLSSENVALPAGKYWISVVPNTTLGDITNGTTRWNWYQSLTSNGIEGHLIDPWDLFGAGATSWMGLSSLVDWTNYDLGMMVEGEETTMGVNDLTSTSISVYPNPATNFVKATGDVKEMTVMNMNGQVVATSKTASVNVSALPKGVYVVKVVDAKGNVTTSKVVKK